jgi:DNA-binding CsgD family transcriptional regulator
MGEAQLFRLVVMAYEAGADPTLWPAFLESYAHLTTADISLFQVHRYPQHRSELITTFGLKERFRASYNDYYSRLNIWREQGQQSYAQGHVVIDQEVYPRELLERSEFYNDYLRPMGGVYSIAGVITRDRGNALVLTGLRDEHRTAWEPSDKRAVEFLLPHVRRAWSIQQKVWVLQAAEVVLDSIPVGVVLLTRDERLVYTNRAAETIFQDDDGLALKAGLLLATDPAANTSIRNAIRSAARFELLSDSNGAFLVDRKSMRRPYQIAILPIRRQFQHFAGMGAPAVLVLITDPEREIPVAQKLIEKLYSLTSKEAKLAKKLATGMSPAEAAGDLGITYQTARTHLKRIYSKMGISRQSELVALLSRVPKLPAD